MSRSDFLSVNLAEQCLSLAGEVNKVYQHLPWALKNEYVNRLKRKMHQMAQDVQAAQDSKSALVTQKRLQSALGIVHECVPLLSLCLRKALLSPDLQERWVKRLNALDVQLSEWLKAGASPRDDSK